MVKSRLLFRVYRVRYYIIRVLSFSRFCAYVPGPQMLRKIKALYVSFYFYKIIEITPWLNHGTGGSQIRVLSFRNAPMFVTRQTRYNFFTCLMYYNFFFFLLTTFVNWQVEKHTGSSKTFMYIILFIIII